MAGGKPPMRRWYVRTQHAASSGADIELPPFGGSDGILASPPPPQGNRHNTKLLSQMRNNMGAKLSQSMSDLSRLVIFMGLLGVIAASFIFIVDQSVAGIFELRLYVAVDLLSGVSGYLVYVSSGVLLCLCSTLVCLRLSTEAEGSGIPQMKAAMSGFYDELQGALQERTLAAKAVGLVCAIGGGLPVGWEGPNVHMSCIIAETLSRLNFFRSLRRDRSIRLQIMSCACTVGLASSFGTPIGAVLYALETTSSFYLVPTFWKSVLATIAGAMVYDILYKTPVAEAFENTNFGINDYNRSQLFVFCILGSLMGCAGSVFVRCAHSVYLFRHRRLTWLSNRFVLVGTVALISGLLQYSNELLRLDPRKAINELFSSDAMQFLTYYDVITLLLVKFPLIAISIGLPIPGGVFIPSFLIGAAMGRLFGELARLMLGVAVIPGLYAVVGAASFTAGVTRALSCSVLIFEVTGQISHMMPILTAVLLSVIVANSFNRSLYDTLIIMKRLPYMPRVREDVLPYETAQHIMQTDVVVAKEFSTPGEIHSLLRQHPEMMSFPVISTENNLLGAVGAGTLYRLLAAARSDVSKSQPADEVLAERGEAEAEVDGAVGGELAWRDVDEFDDDIAEETASSNSHFDGEHSPPPGLLGSRDRADTDGAPIEVPTDISPLIVGESTSLSQLHFTFVMLMPSCAYVISRGKLVGIITRDDIIQR